MKNKAIFYLEKSILFIIAIAPIIYFYQIENVHPKIFILGTGSWGVGCILKILAHQLVVMPLHNKNKSLYFTAIINGFLSGFFELFAAYAIILLMKNKIEFNYQAIIAFGLAIGSFECLVNIFNKGNDVFKGTSLEKTSGDLVKYLDGLQGIRYYIFNLVLPVIERVMATFLHISTRGLVFITIIIGNPLPFFISLTVFVIADGILGYYYHLSGKLATSKGYIQIHLYLLMLTLIVSVIFFTLMFPLKNITL